MYTHTPTWRWLRQFLHYIITTTVLNVIGSEKREQMLLIFKLPPLKKTPRALGFILGYRHPNPSIKNPMLESVDMLLPEMEELKREV